METKTFEFISNPLLKLQENPNLHICSLSHVELGDEGCKRLFLWLRTGIDIEMAGSEEPSLDVDNICNNPRPGYPRCLTHLELNDVQMSDVGFQYMIEWLRDLHATPVDKVQDIPLKTIVLRGNQLEGTSDSAEAFIRALPGTVSSLTLSNNPLSPSFRRTLLSCLPALPRLQRLILPMTGLDFSDIDALTSYLKGENGKCCLITLNVSGNNIGIKGIIAIVDAAADCRSLEKVEMYGNYYDPIDIDDDEDSEIIEPERAIIQEQISMADREIYEAVHGSGSGVPDTDMRLIYYLARNFYLKREVQREALELLKYSRLMLHKLSTRIHSTQEHASRLSLKTFASIPTFESASSSAENTTQYQSSRVIFSMMPVEIQLDILSYLAPRLSNRQRLRIFEYAADENTLPKVGLKLPSPRNDPSNATASIVSPNSHIFGASRNNFGISQSGKKVGSLIARTPPRNFSHIEESSESEGGLSQNRIQKERWLELVGCDEYDPGES